jgi:hypothetical protein
MNEDRLRSQNYTLNERNFRAGKKIKKLTNKLLYTENIKTIWDIKDKIRELKRRILINEQQVRFNLMVLLKDN